MPGLSVIGSAEPAKDCIALGTLHVAAPAVLGDPIAAALVWTGLGRRVDEEVRPPIRERWAEDGVEKAVHAMYLDFLSTERGEKDCELDQKYAKASFSPNCVHLTAKGLVFCMSAVTDFYPAIMNDVGDSARGQVPVVC